ncbi:hypothetical protein A7U60_g3142 [Sanghuangporus baumii]|uniref:Bacteriophage T5 Orf172 DNA-binding domain-containing protein n=1 Tax=Sanghuangporus baumii TaxID=108892 RepID=A0A9Q5I0Y0_SANBA|nr:hypothetical protein A7U60_g3142 [Sanghuangporus baumii]
MSSISSSPSSLSRRTVSIIVQCSGLTKKGLPCKNKVKAVIPSSETQLYTKKLVKVFCYLHKSQAEDDGRRVPCPRPVEKSERRGDHVKPESPSEAAHPDSMSERIHSQNTDDPDLKGVIGNKIQCNGTTSRGRRCRLQVKLRLPSNSIDSKLPLEAHPREGTVLRLYSRIFIPEYPDLSTKGDDEAPSDNDEPGFVYAFQVRDKDRFTVKVGRTNVDLNKRLDQWKKECPAMEQKLLGWWPGNIMIKNFRKTPIYSRIEPEPKGVYTRKLERLVHVELADLALYDLYNYRNSEFHNLAERVQSCSAVSESQKSNGLCSCGKRHKEMFSFKKPETSSLKNDEWDEQVWDEVVMPVIEKRDGEVSSHGYNRTSMAPAAASASSTLLLYLEKKLSIELLLQLHVSSSVTCADPRGLAVLSTYYAPYTCLLVSCISPISSCSPVPLTSSMSPESSSHSAPQSQDTDRKRVRCSGTSIKNHRPCRKWVTVIVRSSEAQLDTETSVKAFCFWHKQKDDGRRADCSESATTGESRVELGSPSDGAQPDLMTPSEGINSQHRDGSGTDVGEDKTQCNGTTTRGRRCRIQVKLRLPPSSIDPNLPLEVFCKYHKKIFEEDGFISRRTQEKVLFSDYIPDCLSQNTQAALRKEMMKPPGDGDMPGFVYTFQIRNPMRFSVKVGRTSTDLKRRLDEWKKACPAAEQNLIGWWPGNIMDKNFRKTPIYSRLEPGPKGVYTQKLERLIHLELADLALKDLYKYRNSRNAPLYPARSFCAIEEIQNTNDLCSFLDEVVAKLAALSLDDLVSEFGDLSLGSGRRKVDDLASGFGSSSPNHQKVEQSGALVGRGSRSAPLHIQHATEGPRIYIDLAEQPDEIESNTQTGFYTSTKGKWVKYSDFIPRYLQSETQLALRREMTKPVSESDEYGYVYAYLIEDEDMPFILRIKIGRTVDVQARLNTWKRECGKTNLKLIGWYPGNIEDENLGANLSRKNRFEPGERGKYCHRLERLVHIELADLVMHTPYLNADLSNAIPTAGPPRPQTGRPSPLALNVLQKANAACRLCMKVHKEIFPFIRPEDGPYKSLEWEKIVKPVIRKWGRFLNKYW